MRFVIVGTGRSGTTWCAEVLQSCGVKCGHQATFRYEHVLGCPWDWDDRDGDASFCAVPALPVLKAQSVRVIHVVRDPERVVRSWLGLGAFGDDMCTEFVGFTAMLGRYAPTVLQHPTPTERAAAFWCVWNQLAGWYADEQVRLEDLNARGLFTLVGREDVYDPRLTCRVPHDANSRPEAKRPVEVESLPGWLWADAERYGYTEAA